jgi:cyclopropane fatty-acyl-phospholipid synthase-like methyltransferase
MGWNIVDSGEAEAAAFELRRAVVDKLGLRKGLFVVEAGCGQGGFTSALSKALEESGKVLAVDISTEYADEFRRNLDKWGVKERVTFIQADVANLKRVLEDEVADIAVGYRFLEELKHPEDIERIIKEIARVVKKGGKVCLVELSLEARNVAEENYIRLHRESGDSLFEQQKIIEASENAGLTEIKIEKFDTDIWFSPDVAKRDLALSQIWFDEDVNKRLGSSIGKYGMKYPALLIFSGTKPE